MPQCERVTPHAWHQDEESACPGVQHSRPDDREYASNYEAGWRWSQKTPARAQDDPLGYADQKGYTWRPGWEEGYVDWAVGDGTQRKKWHSWHETRGTESDCGCR